MWDEIYAHDEYVYGLEPNKFLSENLEFMIPGDVLCIAEGEGRNAVFLAEQGFHVTAVDSSSVGLKKVHRLAAERSVQIETIHADLADYDFGTMKWHNIVSIFCHLPPLLRSHTHAQLQNSLMAGGVLLLEAYSKKQLTFKTGGPSDISMLYSRSMLKKDFDQLNMIKLTELERSVIEGTKHTGQASVVQMIGTREL